MQAKLRNFQIGSVSYEWEVQANFEGCKKVFVEAFMRCYDRIPLESLRQSSREEMRQWLADDFDEFYGQSQGEGANIRWLIAKEDGHLVGFLAIDLEKFPDQVYLAQMAIDPMHQKRGIGSTLVKHAIAQMPEAKKFVVITRIVNLEAQSLYNALGFSKSDYIHEGCSPALYTGFELEGTP